MPRLMKKPAILVLAFVCSFAFIFATTKGTETHKRNYTAAPAVSDSTANTASAENEAAALYSELNLESMGLKSNVFSTAMQGFEKLASKGMVNNNMITIADFSQPSTEKRLYVIDVASKKVLFNTLVAHGRNSGQLMAKNFLGATPA